MSAASGGAGMMAALGTEMTAAESAMTGMAQLAEGAALTNGKNNLEMSIATSEANVMSAAGMAMENTSRHG